MNDHKFSFHDLFRIIIKNKIVFFSALFLVFIFGLYWMILQSSQYLYEQLVQTPVYIKNENYDIKLIQPLEDTLNKFKYIILPRMPKNDFLITVSAVNSQKEEPFIFFHARAPAEAEKKIRKIFNLMLQEYQKMNDQNILEIKQYEEKARDRLFEQSAYLAQGMYENYKNLLPSSLPSDYKYFSYPQCIEIQLENKWLNFSSITSDKPALFVGNLIKIKNNKRLFNVLIGLIILASFFGVLAALFVEALLHGSRDKVTPKIKIKK